MVRPIRSGNGFKGPKLRYFFPPVFLFFLLASVSFGQSPICQVSATNLKVPSEGLTAPVGDILFNCAGGVVGQLLSTNISITLPVAITNRLTGSNTLDAIARVDTGSGPSPSGSATLTSANSVTFGGIAFAIPVTQTFSIRLTNIRASMLTASLGASINASITTSGLSLNQSSIAVATATKGLLASYATSGITCVTSPLPVTGINMQTLFAAGTQFASTRFTEGFSGMWQVKDSLSDTGTRVRFAYSNFPAGSQLYVPNLIAGTDATQPTAGGDIGGQQSPGVYTPSGSGSLLLSLVQGADANGNGGFPLVTRGGISGANSLTVVTQVPLTNGAGSVTYEVIDTNPNVIESAQLPTFIGLSSLPGQTPVIANVNLALAPSSSVQSATANDPVPRFYPVTPQTDCQILGDCGANYFPSLAVGDTSITYNGSAGGLFQTHYLTINNTGGGFMAFSATVAYQTGQGWLTLDQAGALSNHDTLRIDANPGQLSSGVYQATLTVDAGSAGKKTIPITFNVGPPQVQVSSVINAATFQSGPLVAGSLGTIKGSNLAGKTVTVAFDGVPGTVIYDSATQINFQIPATIIAKTSTQMTVTVDGNASQPFTVQLAPVAPGIFGTLNQDNSVNSAAAPAKGGTIIQIFATGLTSSVSGAVTVKIHDQDNLTPLYAGNAPGISGVQQVNVTVPNGLPAIQSTVLVCAVSTNQQRVCSLGAPIYLGQ